MSNWTACDLIGKWMLEPQGSHEVHTVVGEVTIQFNADGVLIYVIHSGSSEQTIFLTYRVANGFLITDQSSHPRVEQTPFSFTSDGKLCLPLDGLVGYFVRT